MGEDCVVGSFNDEMGTFCAVFEANFEEHEPRKWPENYSTPPGGAVVLE